MVSNAEQTPGETAVPAGSVIIPAHNEEASIGRCLSALLGSARPGEFEVIVVCNGCSDGTANAARAFGSMVRVVEIEVGSKIIALNLGNKAARFYPRLYLDADLELSTEAARALLLRRRIRPALRPSAGWRRMSAQVPWLMRQYYAVWNRQALPEERQVRRRLCAVGGRLRACRHSSAGHQRR